MLIWHVETTRHLPVMLLLRLMLGFLFSLDQGPQRQKPLTTARTIGRGAFAPNFPSPPAHLELVIVSQHVVHSGVRVSCLAQEKYTRRRQCIRIIVLRIIPCLVWGQSVSCRGCEFRDWPRTELHTNSCLVYYRRFSFLHPQWPARSPSIAV